jgi:hypothetical protein
MSGEAKIKAGIQNIFAGKRRDGEDKSRNLRYLRRKEERWRR